jgi:hypothetical protein
MKTRRWLCLLPLFTEDIQAAFPRIGANIAEGLGVAPHSTSLAKPFNMVPMDPPGAPVGNFDNIHKQVEQLHTAPPLSNSRPQEQSIKLTKPLEGEAESKDVECLHNRRQRRSLVTLRRRGCLNTVGSGLLAASNGLANAGAGLQRFDKLTARQKLGWFLKKTKNGVKHTVSFGVQVVVLPIKGLAFLGRKTFKGVMAVLRGTGRVAKTTGSAVGKGLVISGYLVYKGGLNTLKLIGRTILHGWKYFGKGLAATGRGLQKAGQKMEAQSTTRLTKKVPPPPTEAARQTKNGGLWNQ